MNEITNIASYEENPSPNETIILINLFKNEATNLEGSLLDLKDKSKSLRNLLFSGISKMLIDLIY
jgi:hypothetical protein